MASFHLSVLLMVLTVLGSSSSTAQVSCKNGQVPLHDYLLQAGIAAKSLEDRVASLETSYRSLNEKNKKSEQEITILKGELAQVKAKLNARGWNLVRVDLALNQLAKIQLHQKAPTYIQQLPMVPPRNTKAIIISVFTNFWNIKGHVYLTFKTFQKRNERDGSVSVVNQHFNIYANTFYYELMLPWDTSLPDELVFKITSSYLTGGNNNYYQVKLKGYITA